MPSIHYHWRDAQGDHSIEFVLVRGTNGHPYAFGDPPDVRLIDVGDFFIGSTPVTQALWTHVMGADANPALNRDPARPVENVSWNAITRPDGFLGRLEASHVAKALRVATEETFAFRLPSETEWEYAARGGPQWQDELRFGGSNDVDAVAWYERRHGDHTQPVAQKAPNQLGIHDMSGNVWEWCADAFVRDVEAIPRDGTPVIATSEERVLRGGCFHNRAEHCTVSKRYEIGREYHDGCIGFRLVLAEHRREG